MSLVNGSNPRSTEGSPPKQRTNRVEKMDSRQESQDSDMLAQLENKFTLEGKGADSALHSQPITGRP